MKIGIIGHGFGIDKALRLLLESKYNDIEIVEVTQEQVDEDERKRAAIWEDMTKCIALNDVRATPIAPPRFDGKTGSNKSDRKRNRKNRWR